MNMIEPIARPVAEVTAPGRLLVVDDQRPNVQALYQAFCADHKVYMATNGEQALAVCNAQLATRASVLCDRPMASVPVADLE
jgi:PleD family two-component response regulator